MGLGNRKLFAVRLKGVCHGNLADNCSPGLTYVVSTSMDKAYNAVCLLYGSDPNFEGKRKDFELDTIVLVADESNPNSCESDSFKLIMADDFFNKFKSDNNKIDLDAIKDFVEDENEQQEKENPKEDTSDEEPMEF